MGAFSQYKYPQAFERYVELGELIGVKGKNDEETFANWVQAAKDLKARIGIPDTVWDWLEEAHPEKTREELEEEFLSVIDQMSEWAFQDACTGANPVYPTIEELKAVYLKCFYGAGYAERYGDAMSVPLGDSYPIETHAAYPLGSVEELDDEVLGGFR
jgi:acetaldehyde dehydrogenase/alcohol dehydrogenase